MPAALAAALRFPLTLVPVTGRGEFARRPSRRLRLPYSASSLVRPEGSQRNLGDERAIDQRRQGGRGGRPLVSLGSFSRDDAAGSALHRHAPFAYLPVSWGVVGTSAFLFWRSRRVSRPHVRLSSSRTLNASRPRPSVSISILSPSWNALKPRWLVPVASMSPGSSVWIDVIHSIQRGILWAMSLVLKFCLSSPFTHSLICRLFTSRISSAVTMHGPIGQNVSRDFIWKNVLPDGGRPRAEPSMKFM